MHIEKIDEILHQERTDKNGRKVTFEAAVGNLPDGVFIQMNGEPYLFANKMIWHWTPFGYEGGVSFSESTKVAVLTPGSVVNAFRSGYRPQIGIRDLK
ncbi:hypothetical protein [Mucilaginibacter sp. 22184]|uniref:hypothetical protein n=1 Tax=Mucilaginibacter sp. 22184 TaxID=3453887 RepID=UPI003F85FE4F